MTALKKFKIAIFLIISIIIIGTLSYMLIEEKNLLDSLYMTIITISTVGFKEVFELSAAGKIFTIFLIISSLSILAFGLNIINSFILEGEFKDLSRRRRMQKKIKRIKDHYIVCGTGQTAQQVIKEFSDAKVNFVVITHTNEPEKELPKIIFNKNITYLEGDATNDEVLKEAKIKQAKGLIAALSTDTDNLFVILSARSLNPNLQIVARTVEESALKKMRKAGASHVISPDIIGGTRMASMILRPSIIDFLDIMCKNDSDLSLKMEQVKIPEKSHINGKTLNEAQIPKKTGLIIVAVKKVESEKFTYNPGPTHMLNSGDTLIVLGKDIQIKSLEDYIKS